ncbi:hypothetical protein [Haladaptatus sp. CMAA 1911]
MTDERDRPLAFSAYEQLADGYAKRAPTSNARRRRDYSRRFCRSGR